MSTKRIASIILDLLIVLASVMCIALTYIYLDTKAKWIWYIIFTAAAAGILTWEISCIGRGARRQEKTSKIPTGIALLNEQGREIRVWELPGHIGILLGKSQDEIEVDIDLSGSNWSELLDLAHLALNYADNGWWAQDLSSKNGSSIVRKGKEILLAPGWPVAILVGDILVLAGNIQLVVR